MHSDKPLFFLGFVYTRRSVQRLLIDKHLSPLETVPKTTITDDVGLSCRFPKIDPFEAEIMEYLQHPRSFKCKKIQEFFSYIDHPANEVRLNTTLFARNVSRVTCYWKHLSKKAGDKNGVDESQAQLLKDPVTFGESGLIQVECYQKRTKKLRRVYFNVHAKSQPIKKTPLHGPDENFLSVYMFIFESMSTARFKRHMKSMSGFMKENRAFNFEGYNKIADNTFVNIVPMLTGLRANKAQRDMGDEFHTKHRKIRSYDQVDSFIWKDFAKKNFVTAFVENESKIGAFSYGKKVGFQSAKPFDYFYRPYFVRQRKLTKRSSNFCFGNDETFASQLNLTQNLFEKYGNRQKLFAMNVVTKPGHDEENDIERTDDTLAQSFRALFRDGAFNKTIIFFLGDHGPRFGKGRLTRNGYFEERLTFLSLILPSWFRSKHPIIARNLRKNQNRLATPFDIHQTLRTILNGNYDNIGRRQSSASLNSRGQDLFREIPKNRTCRSAGVPKFYCPCYGTREMEIDSRFSNQLSTNLVDNINAMMRKRKYDSKCAVLQLKKIYQMTRMMDNVDSSLSTKSHKEMYKLVIQTHPGHGIFEGFLTYDRKLEQSFFEEGVSRLNLYGKQGQCIDSGFEKYCYCKNNKT